MRSLLTPICLASSLLAFAACTPPGAFGADPSTPASMEPAQAESEHASNDSDHDHDGDHDDDGHADHDHGDHDHNHHHAPPRSTSDEAARVRIMQSDTLACGSVISLGPVDVHESMHTEEQALDMLRRRAKDLGAEAVLGVEFHHGEGGPAQTHLSGLAVRCGDLLQGRAYDVVQKIDIPGGMGDEDDAYAALKARAASIGADLIIGIEFKHGDGTPGSETHVSGTAIKLRPQ